MEKQDVKEGILYLLQHSGSSAPDGIGYNLEEIKEYIKLNNIREYLEENILKKLLQEMDREELVEERHFDFSGKNLGRIDYSIENKGIEMIEKKNKILKTKWKLS